MMWMKYFIQTTFLLLLRYKNLIRLLQLIEGGIFMSSDGVWETGEMIFKYFTKEEVKKAPLEIFFEKVGLCNKDQEYPKLVEKVVKENKEIYKVQCPIGLGKSDFKKHADALEVFLGKDVEIKSTKGFIYIEMTFL